jgi:HSP20 family molecular chaperone IbpA
MNSSNDLKYLSKDTINKINILGNQVAESLFDIATPIINTVTNMNIPENKKSSIKKKIKETETTIKIMLCIPGVKKEDINLILEPKLLKIEAETSINEIEWNHIPNKKYVENISIPENITDSELVVKYENGILKILINKQNVNPVTRTKIEIN